VAPDEQQRLAASHEYRLLDAPAEDELEAVVRGAATVAGVPTATLNLIDVHRRRLTTMRFTSGVSPRSRPTYRRPRRRVFEMFAAGGGTAISITLPGA
jgi:hypothetical protein